MSIEFKDVFFCLLPGVVGGVPYRIIWPVRRRVGDVLAMSILLTIASAIIAGGFAKLCIAATGGSMMFGEWGEVPLLASVCLIGLALGTIVGIDCNRRGPDFYPYSPFLFR